MVGRTSFIRHIGFGTSNGSTLDISSGEVAKLVSMRCDAVLLSFYKDAFALFSITAAQSLANMYTTIDAIRARRSDTAIFLLKTWRLQAEDEATIFRHWLIIGRPTRPLPLTVQISVLSMLIPLGTLRSGSWAWCRSQRESEKCRCKEFHDAMPECCMRCQALEACAKTDVIAQNLSIVGFCGKVICQNNPIAPLVLLLNKGIGLLRSKHRRESDAALCI